MEKINKNTLIDFNDIIIVSTPITLHELFAEDLYTALPLNLLAKGVPQNEVFELAILNKDQTRFMLIRHFGDIKEVKNVKDFVKETAFGEYLFDKLKFKTATTFPACIDYMGYNIHEAKVGTSKFYATQKQVENGVKLKNLISQNKFIIKEQISQYYKKQYEQLLMEKQAQKKQQAQNSYKDF